MIELKQVTKQYGQANVLKNITLSIDEPGIYCLAGTAQEKQRFSNRLPGIRILQAELSWLTAKK